MRSYAAIFLLLVAMQSPAANWYVERDATGANNGTNWANAWSDTTNINWAVLSPGDTVYFGGGNTGKIYSAFTTASGGTAGNPLTLKWSAEANHNGPVTLASILTIDSPYVTLDGVHNTNVQFNAYTTTGAPNYSAMTVTTNGDYFELRNVTVLGNRAAEWGHSFGSKANHIMIIGCVFDNTAYEDQIFFDVLGGWLVLGNNVFKNNISGDAVHRDLWNAEFGSGGYDLWITNNMFVDMDDVFLLQNKGAPIGTIHYYYNVSDRANYTLRFGSGNLGATNVYVFNSIFYNTLGTDLSNVSNPVKSNNFYQSGGLFISDVGSAMNPLFVDTNAPFGADGIAFTADDGFNIQAGSPAINAGVNVGLTADILGNSIVGNPDLGAYEYVPTGGNSATVGTLTIY